MDITEVFMEQIKELSVAVVKLNVSMERHSEMLQEIKTDQREHSKLLITVERHSNQIVNLSSAISTLNQHHRDCNLHDKCSEFNSRIKVIESRNALLSKILGVMGAGLVPLIYKLFAG